MGYKEIVKGPYKKEKYFGPHHRFEHWYVDNQVYFITARVRGRYEAFKSIEAQQIFWEHFEHYVGLFSFVAWVVSLLSNHYHMLGYLRVKEDLSKFMRGLHGSVAKLVNDVLPERVLPFWVDAGHQSYFDGCIRDELQARRADRYTWTQCRRHHVCQDPRDFPSTRRYIDLDRAVRRGA